MPPVARKTGIIIPLLKSNLTFDEFKKFFAVLNLSSLSQRESGGGSTSKFSITLMMIILVSNCNRRISATTVRNLPL